MNNFLLAETGRASSIVWLVIMIVLVVVMLVLPSVNQKKRAKAYQEMQERLRAGDKVQTIGGIVGKIVRVKDSNGVKTVLIETGDKNNKTVVEFDINAIAGVVEGLNNPVSAKTEEVKVETETKEDFAEPEMVDVSFENEKEKQEEKPAPKKNSKNKKK